MNDQQKHVPRKHILGSCLWIASIGVAVSPVLAEPQAQWKPYTEPVRVETFLDRKRLKEGEEVGIKVWIESDLIDRAAVTVVFPQSQLDLREELSCQEGQKKDASCEVTLPRSAPVTFAFTGRRVGKCNVAIQVSGQDKVTKRDIIERRVIQDIEIQEQRRWWSTLFSNPLLGVLIGGGLTIVTTILTNYVQKGWAKAQRRQWVLTNLPAQLAFLIGGVLVITVVAVSDGGMTLFASRRQLF